MAHDGITTLFDDSTGTAVSFDVDELEHGEPALTEHDTGAAHHGVAVALTDRHVVDTVGTEGSRAGVRLVGPAGLVLAETDQCPGVHGEAFAEGAAVLGCEDGAVVVSATTRSTRTPSSSAPPGSA